MARKKAKKKATAAVASTTAKPKFGSPAWNAKYGIKPRRGKRKKK